MRLKQKVLDVYDRLSDQLPKNTSKGLSGETGTTLKVFRI